MEEAEEMVHIFDVSMWRLANELEMEVDNCREMLGDGVLCRDNEVARIVGFMDFGEV